MSSTGFPGAAELPAPVPVPARHQPLCWVLSCRALPPPPSLYRTPALGAWSLESMRGWPLPGVLLLGEHLCFLTLPLHALLQLLAGQLRQIGTA